MFAFGLFLLPKMVEFRQTCLDRLQQLAARLFDPLPLGFPEAILLQEVE